MIGYLAREVAGRYCEIISQIEATGRRVTCNADLAGGTQAKENIGVWLDLLPEDDLADLADVQGAG